MYSFRLSNVNPTDEYAREGAPLPDTMKATILATCSFVFVLLLRAQGQIPNDLRVLEQGWTRAEREAFWFSSQGSRLIPYNWFIALEQSDNVSLFRDPAYLQKLGFIVVGPSAQNPHNLPIGFARDSETSNNLTHVGLTCAACHTGELTVSDRRLLVEGGPAMIDFTGFLDAVVTSLSATLDDRDKFVRFAGRVGAAASEHDHLRQRVQTKLEELATRRNTNRSTNPYGHGRVDAFGHIFNQLFSIELGVTANAAPSEAPVSFPHLWDTPHHDFVQWNGSAPNGGLLGQGSLFRNIGELLGVFGELSLDPLLPGSASYRSSVRRSKLVALERLVTKLYSPQWPADLAPLNATLAERGRLLFESHCSSCHQSIERTAPRREIEAKLVALSEVGTDPAMTRAFESMLATRQLNTGPLRGRMKAANPFDRFDEFARGKELLDHILLGAFVGQLSPFERRSSLESTAEKAQVEPVFMTLTAGLVYKARPLNGVWATAPFLHNGSVPTLLDLLANPEARPARFTVGRRFDTVKVGIDTSDPQGHFSFDTTLPGNLNIGHAYGTTLAHDDKMALIEFLKTQ